MLLQIIYFHTHKSKLCQLVYIYTHMHATSLQSCLTLCDPMDYSPRLLCPWDSSGENTGVGCHTLLQGSSWPRDWTLHCLLHWRGGGSLPPEPPEKPIYTYLYTLLVHTHTLNKCIYYLSTMCMYILTYPYMLSVCVCIYLYIYTFYYLA